MGRIFTVDFWYGGRQHTAFVQLITSADHFLVHINVPDPVLHHLIPGGVITYNSKEGISSLHADAQSPSFELIERIIAAIEVHLHD